MSIRAIIVDDEIGSIKSLQWELDLCAIKVDVIATFQDSRQALAFIKSTEIDLLFLDIEMPNLNGFDMLNALDHIPFDIIFITAYDQFAVKAFEISAIDYLLKPVDNEMLMKSLNKIISKNEFGMMERKLELLFKTLNSKEKNFSTLAIPSMDGLDFIEVGEVMRCESSSNYTTLFLVDGQRIVASKTLKEIESMLPEDQFFRIHHSHIVNIKFIRKYRKGKTGVIVLKNGDLIPVSRSRKTDFLSSFG